MSFFILPEIHSNIDSNNIQIKSDDSNLCYISLTLNYYLNNVKKQINDNEETWDFIKKYTEQISVYC